MNGVDIDAMRPPGVHIALLGPPRLLRPDGAARPLERKDAALLALLALDGPAPRARLAALLWPDATPAGARGNLRQRLFRLRAAAGRDVVQAEPALRLADGVTLDTDALEQRLALDPQAGAGELLAGHDYADAGALGHWVQAARERWRGARLALLARRAGAREDRRQIAAALPYALRLLADEPALEHAHRRVMRLHYLRGDRAAAMAAYDACVQTLGDVLGAKPSAETVELARAIERSVALPPGAGAPAPRPTAVLRPPRLVGRDAEWQRLCRLGSPPARPALVSGEPGIGKSRLLGDFAATQQGDAATLCGGRPGDARLPYALTARLVAACTQRFGAPAAWARAELARVLPSLGRAADGACEALRLRQALLHALGDWCAAGLRLLVVDDLHFADDATLELLPALVDACTQRGVPCLLGVRRSETPPALTAWLDAHDAGAAEHIALGPLDQDAVQALLASLAVPGLDAAQWAGPLQRHTGGNPLFVLETLIALLDRDAPALQRAPDELPAPAHVGALIEQRLEQLSPAALKLARLAALAGPDFGVELAAAVLGVHALDIADHWRELEAAQVIRDDGFAHDLIFEATLRTVPAPIARALHREIAAHLQRHGGAPARIAAHCQAAGDWPAAAAAYEAAARCALAVSRRVDELALWQRAADCHEHAGDRGGAFRARCASVKPMVATRPLLEAQAAADRLLDAAGDDHERLDAQLARAGVLLLQYRAEAREAAADALQRARRLGDDWRAFEASRALALALASAKGGDEAVALLQPFEARVQADGTPQQRYGYWSDIGFVFNAAGRRRDAAQALRLAVDAATAMGDREETVVCLGNLASTLAYLGELQPAHDHAERALRLQAELGHVDDVVAGVAQMNVASMALRLGRFDRVLTLYEAALGCFRGGGAVAWTASCEHNLASAWLVLGQTARAAQALRPLPAALNATSRARRLIVEGRIERAHGRTALPRLREALAALGDGGDPVQRALAELDESRELDAASAVEQCRRVRERTEGQQLLALATKAGLLEVEARLRVGDAAGACTCARAMRSELRERQPIDAYQPELLWLLQQAHARGGDAAGAAALLDEAMRWIDAALVHVPAALRDGFLHRQPVNRAVLAAAARQRADGNAPGTPAPSA